MKRLFIAILFFWSGSLWAQYDRLPAGSEFKVIVNPDVAIDKADKIYLSEIFLKKIRNWPDSQPIQPVDLRPNSSVRADFSENVLHRPVSGVRSYWQQMIFSGRSVPPLELENEEAVVHYVSQNPGAIGYVSADADVSGVKTLTLK